jgi:hypothetical protein
MSSTESPAASGGDADFVNSLWARIRAHLEDERERVYEELRSYPRPIPACDQHFNHLLEKRTGIARELERVDTAVAEGEERSGSLEAVGGFINSSNYLDEGAKESLRSLVRERRTRRASGEEFLDHAGRLDPG